MSEWRKCSRCGRSILAHRLSGLRTYCELEGSAQGDFDAAEIEAAYLAVGRKVPHLVADAARRVRLDRVGG